MLKVTVDGLEIEVPAGATALEVCEFSGKEIPRFCYHDRWINQRHGGEIREAAE